MTINDCTYLGTSITPCGCSSLPGKHYCAEHYPLVYQVGTARAKRKKDIRIANQVWDLESEFNAAIQELMDEGYDFAEPTWDIEVEDT